MTTEFQRKVLNDEKWRWKYIHNILKKLKIYDKFNKTYVTFVYILNDDSRDITIKNNKKLCNFMNEIIFKILMNLIKDPVTIKAHFWDIMKL